MIINIQNQAVNLNQLLDLGGGAVYVPSLFAPGKVTKVNGAVVPARYFGSLLPSWFQTGWDVRLYGTWRAGDRVLPWAADQIWYRGGEKLVFNGIALLNKVSVVSVRKYTVAVLDWTKAFTQLSMILPARDQVLCLVELTSGIHALVRMATPASSLDAICMTNKGPGHIFSAGSWDTADSGTTGVVCAIEKARTQAMLIGAIPAVLDSDNPAHITGAWAVSGLRIGETHSIAPLDPAMWAEAETAAKAILTEALSVSVAVSEGVLSYKVSGEDNSSCRIDVDPNAELAAAQIDDVLTDENIVSAWIEAGNVWTYPGA